MNLPKSLMTRKKKKKERGQANFGRFKLSSFPFASKMSANQLMVVGHPGETGARVL